MTTNSIEPTNRNLYALFRSGFADRLDHPFLVVPHGPTLTYGDVEERAMRMAGALMMMGVASGDHLVVQIDKSPDGVALYLACLRMGVVFVTLNTAYTPDEVAFFLGDAQPKVFVCRPDDAAALQPLADDANADLVTLGVDGDGSLADAVATAPRVVDIVDSDGTDIACMLYTSGTTGRSKGAMLTHDGLAATAKGLHDVWGWQRDDVLLHVLPIFHVHGLFVALHPAMLGGSTVLFHPKFELDATLAALPDATVMMAVPTIYNRLLQSDQFTPEQCASMRVFTSGSAPLAADKHDDFARKSGHVVLNRYGMTEAGIITSSPLDGERPAGTVGFAMPGLELRVVDSDDQPLPEGEPGMVQIKGTTLFAGYWQLPEKTASEFTDDGFFITGDIGRLDSEGRLTLDGRSGDMIISGGFNVYPREVELCINETDGVFESAVVGLPHDDLGEAVTAFVVLDDETSTTAEAIEQALAPQLARFKQPKRYLFVDELPRNAMSKVQKVALRKENAELYSS